MDPTVDLTFTSDYVKNHYDELYNKAYYTKMGQKLGFFITEAPGTDVKDIGVFKQIMNPDQKERDLTQEEKDCIDQLMEVKTKTFSDFTDSFRLLSTISAGNVKDDLEPII